MSRSKRLNGVANAAPMVGNHLMIFKNIIWYTEGAISPAPEEPIMPQRQLVLSETERQQLVHLRDHARQP